MHVHTHAQPHSRQVLSGLSLDNKLTSFELSDLIYILLSHLSFARKIEQIWKTMIHMSDNERHIKNEYF